MLGSGGGGCRNTSGDVGSVVEARGGSGLGGGTRMCGGGGGDRSPSSIFLEQPLEREFTPFFIQMTPRVCGGGPFPSYRAHIGLRGERAHLRPTTQNPNMLRESKVHKEEGLHE